ncbi:sensor histidine kinase [Pseudocitrobacter cyperus]|uniref:histidine kinase n=1 Tax=Pseudocitrobacter cyperus TaxID=3112843 RepID=A0ABV0HFC5_9ENTR
MTLFTSAVLLAWCLQQQYEEKSANFRILYREVTVKLSQHDAIIPLLPEKQYPQEVQKILPQIISWRRHHYQEPRIPIVKEGQARYWLNFSSLSLLVDLNTLLKAIPEKAAFRHIALRWNNTALYNSGAPEDAGYWRWDKTIASPSQPFVLSAVDGPEWGQLTAKIILFPAIFWALTLYLFRQYQMNKKRRAIADLRASYSELARLNTLGELAAGIVHELNQPLTAALSYNQAALRLIQQDQTSDVPPLLSASVLQIKRIDDLLCQFRQRLTSEHAHYQPINLQTLWRRVLTLLDNEIRQQKVQPASAFATDLPLLNAPPLWVEQILHNLLSNAIQAQKGHTATPWVHLQVSAEAGGITLTLSDGGPGFSPEALQRALMPFYTTRAEGTGLGMTLVDTLVQRLNGNITLGNQTGGGACIQIWLPVTPQET